MLCRSYINPASLHLDEEGGDDDGDDKNDVMMMMMTMMMMMEVCGIAAASPASLHLDV